MIQQITEQYSGMVRLRKYMRYNNTVDRLVYWYFISVDTENPLKIN